MKFFKNKLFVYLVQGSETNPRGLASFPNKWTISTEVFTCRWTLSLSIRTWRMDLLNPSVHNSILSTGSYARLSTDSLWLSVRVPTNLQFILLQCITLNEYKLQPTFNDLFNQAVFFIFETDAEYLTLMVTNIGEKEFPRSGVVCEGRQLWRVVGI